MQQGNEDSWDIEEIKEYHQENNIHFIIRLRNGALRAIEHGEGIEKNFKLLSQINITNMVLFNEEGIITKYNNVKEILEQFYKIRLGFYAKRKEYLISSLLREFQILDSKMRFFQAILSNEFSIFNIKREELIIELSKRKFKQMHEFPKVLSTKNVQSDEDKTNQGFNYLLNMQLWSLTYEKIDLLRIELERKKVQLKAIEGLGPEAMWKIDIQKFLNEYQKVLQNDETTTNKSKTISSYEHKAVLKEFANQKIKDNIKKVKKQQKNTNKQEEEECSDSEFEMNLEVKANKIVGKPIETKKKIESFKNIQKQTTPLKQSKEEKKIENKPKTLSESILKYLNPIKKPEVQSSEQQSERTNQQSLLNLEERIRLRQEQNDIKPFYEGLNEQGQKVEKPVQQYDWIDKQLEKNEEKKESQGIEEEKEIVKQTSQNVMGNDDDYSDFEKPNKTKTKKKMFIDSDID